VFSIRFAAARLSKRRHWILISFAGLRADCTKGRDMKAMLDMVTPLIAQRWKRAGLALVAALGLAAAPAAAQGVETFDPDEAYAGTGAGSGATGADAGSIDADLVTPGLPGNATAGSPPSAPVPVRNAGPVEVVTSGNPGFDNEFADFGEAPAGEATALPYAAAGPGEYSAPDATQTAATDSNTYGRDDLIGAAEGVFGKGAEGLAGLIEDLLSKQGEPNGYIVGREASGAFIFGARYGSGMLHHKIEGQRKVYWTGPSVGFDAGANAASAFVLVYNLYDTQDIFKRFPAGEGQAYFVGGLHVSYVRRGDVVLIPIRVGAGLRLGVNAGYLKFSEKQRWLPF
jgi:hypothetical protein